MCSTAQYVFANTIFRLHGSSKEWAMNTLNESLNVEEQFDVLRKGFSSALFFGLVGRLQCQLLMSSVLCGNCRAEQR